MVKKLLTTLVLLLPLWLSAQYNAENVQRYIAEYKDYAMKLMEEDLIPASIRLAQAIHATEGGTNKLCHDAKNHFAIPCPEDHQGNSFTAKVGNVKMCYQSYNYPAVSYADHTIYLRGNSQFSPIFKLPLMDYKAWALGLQSGKYSSEKDYAVTLIRIIEEYKLASFDTLTQQRMEINAAKRADRSEEVYFESGVEVVVQKQPKPKTQTRPQECKKDSVFVEEIEEKADMSLSVFKAADFEFKPAYFPHAQRKVFENNSVKFVLAKKGETYEMIAKELKLAESVLREYNDIFDEESQPVENEVIYVEAKNKKSSVEYHTIKKGESVRYIAQKYAVPFRLIFEKNGSSFDEFSVGNVICISCKK